MGHFELFLCYVMTSSVFCVVYFKLDKMVSPLMWKNLIDRYYLYPCVTKLHVC